MYREKPGVALGSDAIYIVGNYDDNAAILKCPTTSIAPADCDTLVAADEEAFYTDDTYTTEVSGGGVNNYKILNDM